jgi:hypothetical protein
MVAKHPTPATYIGDTYHLYAETFEHVTGQEPPHGMFSVADLGFNPSEDPELTGLTGAQLSQLLRDMMSREPTGQEIQISLHGQVAWLAVNDELFKREEEIDI